MMLGILHISPKAAVFSNVNKMWIIQKRGFYIAASSNLGTTSTVVPYNKWCSRQK